MILIHRALGRRRHLRTEPLLRRRTVPGDRGVVRGATGGLAGAGGAPLSLIFATTTTRQGQGCHSSSPRTHQLQGLSAGYGAIGEPLGQRIEERACCWSVFVGRNTEEILLFCVHRAFALSPEGAYAPTSQLTQDDPWRRLMAEASILQYPAPLALSDTEAAAPQDPGPIRLQQIGRA